MRLIHDVAHLEPSPERTRTLRGGTASAAPPRGRTCYDHLAGRLDVAITDAMTRAGLLDQTGGFALTAQCLAWLTTELRVDPAALSSPRRPIARGCLDWTERRSHLGGVAGGQLCRRSLGNRWIRRIGSGRAERLTAAGEAALRDLLDFAFDFDFAVLARR